jgi:hypothetical protein
MFLEIFFQEVYQLARQKGVNSFVSLCFGWREPELPELRRWVDCLLPFNPIRLV